MRTEASKVHVFEAYINGVRQTDVVFEIPGPWELESARRRAWMAAFHHYGPKDMLPIDPKDLKMELLEDATT
jgi:hypothetical protein